MPAAIPRTPAERFAGIVEDLCRVVAASHNRGRGLAGPLIILIWTRLRRIQGRFARLVAHLRAGTLRARAPSARRRSPARSRPDQPPPLPRGFAWLRRLVPQASAARSQLQYLLMDPEMAALIAAAPQAGRVLRPLCQMLGLRLPPELRLSPRMPPPAPAASVPPTARKPAAPKPAAAKPAAQQPRRLAAGRAPPATAGPPPTCKFRHERNKGPARPNRCDNKTIAQGAASVSNTSPAGGRPWMWVRCQSA